MLPHQKDLWNLTLSVLNCHILFTHKQSKKYLLIAQVPKWVLYWGCVISPHSETKSKRTQLELRLCGNTSKYHLMVFMILSRLAIICYNSSEFLMSREAYGVYASSRTAHWVELLSTCPLCVAPPVLFYRHCVYQQEREAIKPPDQIKWHNTDTTTMFRGL